MEKQSAVVIGAGVAGLATATLLSREGYQVTIIDRLDKPGGRAGEFTTSDAPGFRWDAGPSWYLMPEAFDHFYALCGTSTQEQLDLIDLQPAYRVISEPADPHTPEVLDISPETVIDTFEKIEPGAGKRLAQYLDNATLVYEVAIHKFLYNNFTRPLNLMTREMVVHARLLAILLTRSLDAYAKTVARDIRLQQVLSYPAVFLSTQPKQAPALYSLMSHTDLIQGPKCPRGGFTAVVESLINLARDNGVHFELGTEATEVVTFGKAQRGRHKLSSKPRVNPRVRGVRVRDGETARLIPADIVVSAADLKHTETKLLPPHLRTYPEKYWVNRDPGLGTVLIYAGVKGKLPELAHHSLLLSKDWGTDFDAVFGKEASPLDSKWSRSMYVSKTSATDDNVAPEGYENLFVLIPTAAEPDLGHGNAFLEAAEDVNASDSMEVREEDPRVQDIAKQAIDVIARWAGIEDLASRIVISKTVGPQDFAQRFNAWDGGAIGPAHTLAQSAFFRGKNISSKVDNLYYAGATTVPGVGVPLCLISAENIIKRLREDHTTGPLPTASRISEA